MSSHPSCSALRDVARYVQGAPVRCGKADHEQNGALRVQGTLDPFFDLSAGAGNYAPRRRTTANVSKRLMAVIKEYREAEARVEGKQPEEVAWDVMMDGLDPEDPKGRGTGKRRRSEGSEVLESVASSVKGDNDADEEDGELAVDDGWELQALAAVEKIEKKAKKPRAPAAKPKRPVKAPAVTASEDGHSHNGRGDDEDEDDADANFTVKKAKPRARPNLKPRSKKETAALAAAAAARVGVESGDVGKDESVEGMRPVEAEPGRLTGPERRAEQKKWRRSVTAGSVVR